jgi:hypothetical protein
MMKRRGLVEGDRILSNEDVMAFCETIDEGGIKELSQNRPSRKRRQGGKITVAVKDARGYRITASLRHSPDGWQASADCLHIDASFMTSLSSSRVSSR